MSSAQPIRSNSTYTGFVKFDAVKPGLSHPRTRSLAPTNSVETCFVGYSLDYQPFLSSTVSSTMRLINTRTGEFEEFVDQANIPPYAILSHTWDPTGEQTYQEVVKIQEKYRHRPSIPQEDALSNSHSEVPDPEPVPEVLSTSEAHTTPSETPLLMSEGDPTRSRSIWRCLALSELEPPSIPIAPPDPEFSSDILTPSPPPTTLGSIWDHDSELSEKVREACEIARNNGYRYLWIDSCCINKESSSELSEAINSMFSWYRNADVCFAFLVDVPSDDDVRAKDSKFRESRWFQRGWTLQELVAPFVVEFLSKDWKPLGTKEWLAELIKDIASIDIEILTHKRALSDESVANRMGWASRRETTRVEDQAYSLLGIFGITMPTLYGEGEYAFRRLQEEILRRIPDQSLFAWGSDNISAFPETSCEIRMSSPVKDTVTLLASSPSDFTMKDYRIIPATEDSFASLELPVEEYTHTPYGIRTQLCLLPLQHLNPNFKIIAVARDPTMTWYLAILRAQKATNRQGLLSQLCFLRKSDKANVEFLYRPGVRFLDKDRNLTGGLYELSPGIIARMGKLETHLKTVHLPHPLLSESVSTRQFKGRQDYRFGVNRWSLTIPTRVQDVLRLGSFTVSNIQGPTEHHRNSFSFTLLHVAFNIHLLFRRMANPLWFCVEGETVMINARAWILPPGDEGLRTTTIQLSPPSDSTTWVARRSGRGIWDTSLPSQCLILTTGLRDKVAVSLSLGLDLTALFRYTLRVDGPPQISGDFGPSFQPHSKDTERDGLELELPYKTLDFMLRGSTRRALEMKGYSAHLSLEPNLGDAPSHSLTLSTDTNAGKFAIVVKYLQVHMLNNVVLAWNDLNLDFDSKSESGSRSERWEEMVIIARITLESSDVGFETVQDGPHVVAWFDSYPWDLSLGRKVVVLTTPSGDSLTLQLGFDLAWLYENSLHIDITPGPPALQPLDLSSTLNQISCYNEDFMPGWAHKGISLTLPAHVNRALQAQGFQVRFERLEGRGVSGDPIHHLLTLSHTRAGFDIVIKYFHDLTTDYPDPDSNPNDPRYHLLLAEPQLDSDHPLLTSPATASVKRCRQELTFKASVQMFASRSVQIGDAPSRLAVHDDVTTAEVNWQSSGPWDWHLGRKDITFTLPTGHQLILRLGFDLVWYSEYFPTVEINPRKPPPQFLGWESNETPMPDYEQGDDGMEYIWQAVGQSTEPGVGQPAEAPDDDSDPLLADPSTLEGSSVGSGEPEDAGNSQVEEQPREGAVVEAQGDAMELLTHSAAQSHVDDDTSDADSSDGT
ncbi:hypothetical protein GSI_13221 [Ganoderma sinense ZZ0214-1]|uniref:Uncharacterized protein n=1 Tax=Ganoderma sinense ZZ0214-1 TaxID=1077348 RepID=A0A2G8RUZ0_9APHY|nr:hypothetical protein GSI_13221 [Ganoderma sinense ZZ0214-1]